ncbi:MAG: hypothetical protein RI932_1525 [Pseudomonadota bacterium]|jgi:Co/Zn/Cd efflux system component
MGDCCQSKSCDLEKICKDQSKVLWSVLTINANTFVLAAAGVVGFTNPPWPDIVVASGITILFFKSEIDVLAGARPELAHEAGMRAWV